MICRHCAHPIFLTKLADVQQWVHAHSDYKGGVTYCINVDRRVGTFVLSKSNNSAEPLTPEEAIAELLEIEAAL